MEITGRDNELVELDSFLTEALVLAKEGLTYNLDELQGALIALRDQNNLINVEVAIASIAKSVEDAQTNREIREEKALE